MSNPEPIWSTISEWTKANPGTGSAAALERLTVSLWSPHYRYSLASIFSPLDEVRAGWVVTAVAAYAENGERDRDFMALAQKISDRYEAEGIDAE